MRTLSVLAIAALLGNMSGSALVVRSPVRDYGPRSAEAVRYKDDGKAHFFKGRYTEAEHAFTQAHRIAIRDADLHTGVTALYSLGNCQSVRLAYQSAMSTYLKAKQLAEQIGDTETVLIAQSSIAGIYAMMGDYAKTVTVGEDLLARFGSSPNPARAYVQLYVANADHRLKHFDRAESYFRQSVKEAGRTGNTRLQAMALDHFGLAFLDRAQPEPAQPLLKQALALRQKSVTDEVAFSHRSLGVLYSRLNRPAEALPYLDQAIASLKAKPRNSPIYELYGERAAVHAALGHHDQGLSDYRTAFDYTRRWRLEVLPAGLLPAHWEGSLRKLRSSFIRFAAEHAIEHNKPELALEALVAAEESRLASLRDSYKSNNRAPLPAEYHQTLRQMQEAEAALLAQSPDALALRRKIERFQADLTEMEARARVGSQLPVLPPDALALARAEIRRLKPDEAILSFYLDEPNSFRWEVTKGTVRVHRLPGRKQLGEKVDRFRSALLASNSGYFQDGRELYDRIFGGISQQTSAKPVWTFVLDDRLFELPLAGLPIPSAKDEFLIDRHTLRIVPSLFLAGEEPSQGGTDFVGVGDPIYNLADSRATANRDSVARKFQLPRLLGSAAEVDQCARIWGDHAETLKGPDVNLKKLTTILRKPVRVLHFATHFVRSGQDSSRTMIALGFGGSSKDPELLGDEQITALQANADMVVLSGCQSGAGPTISGAGLLGLTRSWLIGGAGNVAASHWPTPDDTGEIFLHFYRHYAQTRADRCPYGAARAMRDAQLDMRRSSGWRSSPRYWAAFFLMSKG